ncbi:MAG: radical family heme chaperone HemW [Bacteroidota bacterium]|jgi:oxygen-independent coproporphyrinogen-3 oxidase
MAGIYLHIPFCRKACHYCDFHFTTTGTYVARMIDDMLHEMAIRRDELGGGEVQTIYFGGGTPSLLSHGDICRLIDKVYELFPVGSSPEITLEANPDDLNASRIRELASSPVNRLSIGIQSFVPAHLVWMNRAHTAREAEYSVKASQDAGFTNITVDLIYGIPAMTFAEWIDNVNSVIGLNVPHVSAYCLTIEPDTVFGRYAAAGKLKAAPSEQSADQFIFMVESLAAAGIKQYEVSNFAVPGFESRHNSAYWSGAAYLGIGPSAHSFDGNNRSWNVANNHLYMKGIETGIPARETEVLDDRMRYNESIMTALRTTNGVDLNRISTLYGVNLSEEYEEYLASLTNIGDALISDGFLKLTTQGMLKADRIASDLFKV